jgi:hypothetical protein
LVAKFAVATTLSPTSWPNAAPNKNRDASAIETEKENNDFMDENFKKTNRWTVSG